MFLQHYMTGGTPKVPLQFNQWLDLKKKKKKVYTVICQSIVTLD